MDMNSLRFSRFLLYYLIRRFVSSALFLLLRYFSLSQRHLLVRDFSSPFASIRKVLPNEIVYHTLSFLSTKEAALTSVLSKRWRNQFAFTKTLCFEEKDFTYRNSDLEIPRSFRDFLDRVLVVSGNFPLKKFSLKYPQVVGSAHINRWICNMLSRGVLDLDLDIIALDWYSLPLEVFTCKTIVKLKLGKGFDISMVPENSSLPALKTLFLDFVRLSNQYGYASFEAFISACPVLEELVMLDVKFVDWQHTKLHCTISCLTLQRLTIINSPSSFDGPDSRSFAFDTPSVAYLKYYDMALEAYPVINLDSPVEAKFGLTLMFPDSLLYSDPTNLIKGSRNVEILDLSTRTMEAFYVFRDAIPIFENLHHLSIASDDELYCWRALPYVLKNAPNLKTLVIQVLNNFDIDDPCSFVEIDIEALF